MIIIALKSFYCLTSNLGTITYRIMPELRGLLKNNHPRAVRSVIIVDRGARALSDLMYLFIVLEPAGHYCGH